MQTPTRRAKPLLVAALTAAMLVGSFGTSSAFLDKTRFVAHLGVAYFCFHHWVLKPYQEGAFADGAAHRTTTIVKGGVALLFAVHEVRVAEKIAHASSDPLLQKLDGGVQTLMGSFGTIGAKLKSGTFDPKDIAGLKAVAGSLSQQAAANGTTIKDIPAAVPGS